jgi:hypothetical protein
VFITELEKSAEKVVAGSCALIAKENNADAAKLVQFFLDDARRDGIDLKTTMEALARAGIVVALLAAEPDSEETFDRVIQRLGAVHE